MAPAARPIWMAASNHIYSLLTVNCCWDELELVQASVPGAVDELDDETASCVRTLLSCDRVACMLKVIQEDPGAWRLCVYTRASFLFFRLFCVVAFIFSLLVFTFISRANATSASYCPYCSNPKEFTAGLFRDQVAQRLNALPSS